jgi:hypothetical protein
LERGLASELHGTVQLDHRAEGLVCTIRTQASDRMRPSEPAPGEAI